MTLAVQNHNFVNHHSESLAIYNAINYIINNHNQINNININNNNNIDNINLDNMNLDNMNLENFINDIINNNNISQRDNERQITQTQHQEIDMTCSICFEECTCQETGFGESTLTLTCGHNFHHSCIVPWLHSNNTCPMCRQPHMACIPGC